VGVGQTPGEDIGQLPAGYAPLPAALQAQTLAAVKTILNPPSPATTPTATPPAPTVTQPPVSTAPLSTFETETSAPPLASPPTTTTPASKPLAVSALALHATGQPYFGVGAVRWAFVIMTGVGLGATLGTVLVEIRRRKHRIPASQGLPDESGN
jgi:hypothetical protein